MAAFTATKNLSTNLRAYKNGKHDEHLANIALDYNDLVTDYNALKATLEAEPFYIPLSLNTFKETTNFDVGATIGGTGRIDIPLFGTQLATGVALAVFADGASTTPGYAVVDSEALGIRWNDHANPDPIGFQFSMPPDVDTTANMTLNVIASKTGATVGDAVTWLVTAFNHPDGALHDADADFGGTSSAMTGDATAKTVQHETLTLGLADLAAAPNAVSMTIQPTDGTLGTDDVVIEAIYITYTSLNVLSPAGGGLLSSSTTPTLEAINDATDGCQRILWVASNNDQITINAILHPDLDVSANLLVHCRIVSGGTTDAVGFTVDTFFNEGDTKVVDTSGTNQTTTYAEVTATIALADIPAGAQTITIGLTPIAHTTDTLAISACWLEGVKARTL